MKAYLYIFPLLLLACGREALVPFQSCSDFHQNTPDHPHADAYQAVLDAYTARGVPGTVAAIYTPEDGLWMGASGQAVIETGEPMQTCHIFFSASLAKTYHVVAAMALAEEGLLNLDQPIDQYLSETHASKIPNSDKVLVQQLMNHTSGIPDFIDETQHVMDYFHNLKRVFSQEEYLEYIADKEPRFEPGTNVSYSNTNTVLLALIMDQIYGNHAKAITDKIIQPLGLSHTFYKQEAAYPSPTGLVNSYIDLYGSSQLQNSTEWELNFSQMSIGHDGMLINPYDNFVFLKALFEGEIIGQAMVDSMLNGVFRYPRVPIIGQGLGLEMTFFEEEGLSQRIGHNGGSLGGANEMRYYPETGVYICVSSNFGGFVDSPIADLYYPSFRGIGQGESMYAELEKIAFGM